MTILAAWLIRLWDSSLFRGLVGLLVLVAMFWGFYAFGVRTGDKRARADEQAKALAAVAQMNVRYREQEKAHDERIQAVRLEYAASEASARASDARVSRDLADGVRRVRVKVARCRPDPAPAGGAATGTDGAATAELAPAVAADLWSIAVDCDGNTRQLTALQAWARSAVVLCNGSK